MEELLKCKDLTNNKRVIAAYWALRKRMYWPHKWQGACTHGNYPVSNDCECYKCSLLKRDWTEKDDCKVPDTIPGSLADIAFEMRDACLKNGLFISWKRRLEQLPSIFEGTVQRIAKPKECWIIAATLAWEGAQK